MMAGSSTFARLQDANLVANAAFLLASMASSLRLACQWLLNLLETGFKAVDKLSKLRLHRSDYLQGGYKMLLVFLVRLTALAEH